MKRKEVASNLVTCIKEAKASLKTRIGMTDNRWDQNLKRLKDLSSHADEKTEYYDEEIWTFIVTAAYASNGSDGISALAKQLVGNDFETAGIDKAWLEALPIPPRSSEGNTNLDLCLGGIALRQGTSNGIEFDSVSQSIIFCEMKWYSDLSHSVTGDHHRNQLIRVIENALTFQSSSGDPKDFHVVLVTPRAFKNRQPASRFYQCKFEDYTDPKTGKDNIEKELNACCLPTRHSDTWNYPSEQVNDRINSLKLHWVTFEDLFKNVPSTPLGDAVRRFACIYNGTSDPAKDKPPISNSYWLEPGHILCGEYPRDVDDLADHEAMTSILETGVRCFVDLTEEGELKPYRTIAEDAAKSLSIAPDDLEFHRHSIRDVSVPLNREEMDAILRTIRLARHQRKPVYLHCWGGRGRTGTVAGCALRELFHLSGEDSLNALSERWLDCAKSEFSQSPETEEQRGFVRSFNPVESTLNEQVRSAIFGAAIGDALGVPFEFKGRDRRKLEPATEMTGYGTHHQPAGTWSDDTSMILATMDGLASTGDYSLQAIIENFGHWYKDARFTPHGEVFDIGGTTRNAIIKYQFERWPSNSGSSHESSNGNGSLMRILPIALAYGNDPTLTNRAFEVSALTHAHFRSKFCCAFYCLVVSELMKGIPLVESTEFAHEVMSHRYDFPEREQQMLDALHPNKLFSRTEDEIRSSGHVIDTLEAALWVNHQHDNYRDVVLHAVNLGDDTDTTGCVAGGLAGLIHGEAGIPEEWLNVLVKREAILKHIEQFTEFCQRGANRSVKLNMAS
tara:strand:- start:2712 stop:5078 length:2367 start_codon:yes stop_codon:yes gene_type:complete